MQTGAVAGIYQPYFIADSERRRIGQLISVLHRRHSDIVRAISVYDDHNRLFVTSNF
ncbi:hypothetical protein MJN51_05680, partial [Salmonella enterica subsp. enterica serovar Kentucky]|nr:hypothetical protein [Salmonella enterica subsp. enterica serovar Kentucky]